MAGTLGAATCAFVGSKLFNTFHDVNNCIHIKNVYNPDKSVENVYSNIFQSYKDVYKDLKKAYIRANFKRFNY